jgi:hypothetical protein
MSPDKEFGDLVAIWSFIAEEYARTRDPKLLEQMDKIERSCEILRNRICAQSSRWPTQHIEITSTGVHLRGRS